MSHISLQCVNCRASFPANMSRLLCDKCQAPLDVFYESPGGESDAGGESAPRMPKPTHEGSVMVTLGEGNTPVVELTKVGKLLGSERLYGKLEFLNPTGSFKDRGTATLISVALELGVAEIVEDSSGNAGASIAAYTARAGIKAHIFAPAGAPSNKIRQIRVYGAEAHLVEGLREAATQAAVEFYRKNDLLYASHNLSPYFVEGTKTFAYEVFEQFADGLPAHIVMPVGNGSLFIGAWKGFQELKAGGHIGGIPTLHCIQAQAVRPIVDAFQGRQWSAEDAQPTVAGGISVANPPRLSQVVAIVRASGGQALAVSESEILRWHGLLSAQEGIYAEPTSAAAFAGVDALIRQGHIGSGDLTLVPITGFGLKDTTEY